MNPYFNQNYFVDEKYHFKGYGIDSVVQFFSDSFDIINKNKILKNISKNRPTFENTFPSVSVIESANRSLKSNGKWVSC